MKAKDLFLLVSAKLQDLDLDNQRWPWEPGSNIPSLVDYLNNTLC
jgi:hypothetical protein